MKNLFLIFLCFIGLFNQIALAQTHTNSGSTTPVTATGSTTSRTLATRAADVANVLDYGADPTGNQSSDNSVAFNLAAAAVSNGSKSAIYVPCGTYHMKNAVNIGTMTQPQTIYGNGLCSIIDINSDFSPTATGVFVLAGGAGSALEAGPVVDHLHIFFHQVTTQTSRANFTTLSAGCTVTTNGTGCEYPPAIYATTVDRMRVTDNRIEGAWTGINYTGVNGSNYGGLWIQRNEIEALNIGIYIENNYDFGHVNGNHFWPFSLIGTATDTNIRADGNDYAMQIGRSDAIDISDTDVLGTRISLLSDFSFGQLARIKLDIGAELDIAGSTGPGVQIDGIYETGTTKSGNCAINASGSLSYVLISDAIIQPTASSAICYTGSGGGTVEISNSYMNTTSTSLPVISVSNSSGQIRFNNDIFDVSTSNSASGPVITNTGTAALKFQNNSIFTTGTGVAAISQPDTAGTVVSGNFFNKWLFVAPGPLGSYGPNYQNNSTGLSDIRTYPNGSFGIGKGAMSSSQSGATNNFGGGGSACAALTTGTNNTCLGANAGATYPTTGSSNVLIGNGINALATTTANEINIASALTGYAASPTINTGFGTSPTSPANGSTFAFSLTVGTSPGGTGTITFPTSPKTGWVCDATDETSNSSIVIGQTADSSTSASFAAYSRTTGSAVNFNASDVLIFLCLPR